jgi:hypothetical protein
MLLAAAPAGAVVTESEGVQVGVQPRTEEIHFAESNFANNNGNAVVDGASVYLVFWDPGAWYHPEWVTKLDDFAQHLGAASGEDSSIFAALSQYRDRSNTPAEFKFAFKGSYTDTAPYPAAECTDPAPLEFGQLTCLTDAQLREQLQTFIAGQGTAKGMHAVYYLMTPPGVSVCLTGASTHCSDFSAPATPSYENSFCSYHGAINPSKAPEGDEQTILYGAIPWTAGYEGQPRYFEPSAAMSGQAADCQDGGWNPEKHGEKHEAAKILTKEEEEKLAKETPEEKAKAARARELENPHIEEPNQEPLPGLSEGGDYAAGLSDVLVNQIAVEQANIVTNPLLASWQNQGTGAEATDECRNVFASTAGSSTIAGSVEAGDKTEAGTLYNSSIAGGTFYVNNVINNGTLHYPGECVGGYGLVPRFTSPNPVNSGEVVDFNGMGSTVSEFQRALFGASGPPTTTWANYTWDFGDGTTVTGYAPGANPNCQAPWLAPCAGSAFHAYTYGGTYNVSLTITDVGGHVAKVEHTVAVNGPAPPSPPGGGSGGSGTGTGTGSGSGTGNSSSGGSNTTGSGAGTAKPTAIPLAAAAGIVSRSLKRAVRRGLSVRYTVNQQAAGHFELMISQALAHRLKISGTPATGLAPGTAPQVVIGRAVLVASKAGAGAVTIKLSGAAAARLRKAHSLAILLRLVVRNAPSAGGTTKTVLSSATLG